MEGTVIEISSYELYHNKGKRCVAVRMHDGSIIKLIVTEAPELADSSLAETPISNN